MAIENEKFKKALEIQDLHNRLDQLWNELEAIQKKLKYAVEKINAADNDIRLRIEGIAELDLKSSEVETTIKMAINGITSEQVEIGKKMENLNHELNKLFK